MNVKSVFFFIKDALHLLKRSSSGANILVTSSILGLYPNKNVGVYGMGKAAINNLVKWLSVELMEDNIRVNAIAPGLTRSKMTTKAIELAGENLPKKALAEPE